MKKTLLALTLSAVTLLSGFSQAADYKIDTEGNHAFINFKIKHLGYSWLTGRFNDFDGIFSYDSENVAASEIKVIINTASIDSNHAERDKHLRSDEFLGVKTFPSASFTSTNYEAINDKTGTLTGELTLHGVTKIINFPIEIIGEGADPWGEYRAGFSGKTTLKLSDYDIDYNLGPASTHVELELLIEGVRQ